MTDKMEIVETWFIEPWFALEIARGNIKGFSFEHISWIANVWVTPTTILEYEIPAWKTGYVTFGKISTGQGKEVFIDFQYSANWIDFTSAHKLYCYETNYEYKFTVPLKMPEGYVIKVVWTDGALTANTSASFDIILIDNYLE